jgi:uncharacterized ferredoxin-like protein
VTISSKEAETEVILYAAKLMAAAARTAPKAGGRDSIKIMILTGKDKDRLADAMSSEGRAGETNPKNVRAADAVILIGVDFDRDREEPFGMRLKLIDLGIALGSAVKVASDLNIDNRIFYTAGRAAIQADIMKADEVQGIPIAIRGKNIFFDRHAPNEQSEKKTFQT